MDLNLITKIMELKSCFDRPKYRVVSHLAMLLIMVSRDTEEEFNETGELLADILDGFSAESTDPFKHVFEVNALIWRLPNSSKGIMFGNDDLSIKALTRYVSEEMALWNEEFFEFAGDPSTLENLSGFYSNLSTLSREVLGYKGLNNPDLEDFRNLIFNGLLTVPLKVTQVSKGS